MKAKGCQAENKIDDHIRSVFALRIGAKFAALRRRFPAEVRSLAGSKEWKNGSGKDDHVPSSKGGNLWNDQDPQIPDHFSDIRSG